MNKYQKTFVNNVRKQLEVWLNSEKTIQHKELYRFLHSIAGTAETIELYKVGELSHSLLSQLNENEERDWTQEILQVFLLPLISLFYYEQYSNIGEFIERKEDFVDKNLILLIDDDTTLIMYLKDVLEDHGWVVIAVADPERANSYYYDLDPDCVIINVHIHEENGFDILVNLMESMKKRLIPVIIISEDATKEIRLRSYRLGADDFIQKPIEKDELIVRINRQLERKQAIDELVLMDDLTKVYNRKYLQQAYERLVSNLKRGNDSFCIALLDLDHFKQVNDKYGHTVGDKVLVTFAGFMTNSIRPNDIIIRYGGEEFLLLLPETQEGEAKIVLERLLREFSKTLILVNDGSHTIYCTFSAGVHEINLAEIDLKRNLEIADSALYDAKSAGRNRVKIATVDSSLYHKKPIHVGVVDDDPIIRTMLTDLISKSKLTEGFTLDIQSFKDGLDFYESNWYLNVQEQYLIILDGMMPHMDGIEVLRKLREQQNQERFTIIMLTSRKSEQDIARAIQLGADDYITKPFKLLELETRLGYLIKRMK